MLPTTRLPLAPASARSVAQAVALLAIVLAAAGCSQGFHRGDRTPPASPEGNACLQRCQLSKAQCRQRQEVREQECGKVYAVAKAEYERCVQSGTARCKAPYTCLGADLSICDLQHEDCVAACPDRIEEGTGRPANAAPSGNASNPEAAESATQRPENRPSTERTPAATPSSRRSAPARMDPP